MYRIHTLSASRRVLYTARRRQVVLSSTQLQYPTINQQETRSFASAAKRKKSKKAAQQQQSPTLPTKRSEVVGPKKAVRKHENRYKNAARSIPYWLGNDPDCYAWTLEALQLNPNGKEEQYRQIYLDSLASFYDVVLVGDDNDNPAIKTQSLQLLVDAGFDDLQFAKQFRKMKIYHFNREGIKKRIGRKRRQHNERCRVLQELKDSLAAAELDVTERAEQVSEGGTVEEDGDEAEDDEEADDEQKEGFLTSLMGRFQSMFGAIDEKDDPDVLSQHTKLSENANPFTARHRRAIRKVSKLNRQIEKATEGAQTSQQQLHWLQEEFDDLKPSISAEQYEAILSIVKKTLFDTICPALAVHIRNRHKRMIEQYQTFDSKTDLTKPHEWYMHARLDRRKIIFHGGPTNSGKTYSALQRLKTADCGLYVGPLRLLAAEVYETLTSQGVYTNLYTGQETRNIPFATHTAATVELALQADTEYDVAVIDEIQMMADASRGFAWTRALLGLRCREIHVCGGMEALPLVRKMAKDCGDEFVVEEYQRFSPLTVADTSLATSTTATGSYKNVQPGDCVVAFSRADIFAIKREIESMTNYKCCIIYGSLPPETRTDQARRFNNQDSGYDILVASDAIGMGLNLNIRRIIFNSIFKSNGETIIRLDHSAVKQIAGRAGRRNSPYPEGVVTCRDPRDLEYLHNCLATEIAIIPKAGLLPTAAHIEQFSAALLKYGLAKRNHDEKDLYKILVQFAELATLQGDFFLCRQTAMRVIARFLTGLDMDIRDKYTLCMAPVSVNHERSISTLRKFAAKHARGEVSGLTRSATSMAKKAKTFDDLGTLCEVHADLDLFLWLHNRFPGNVMEQQSALTLKARAIGFINRGLQETEKLKLDHCYISRDARLRNVVKKNADKESEQDLVW